MARQIKLGFACVELELGLIQSHMAHEAVVLAAGSGLSIFCEAQALLWWGSGLFLPPSQLLLAAWASPVLRSSA
eukprot:CAMPEP_0172595670 /NCGR_PEP_ID=MMETSP1068-20121228/15294_1 /TAXON_ID=35684 /ORGANISM="Pseudopedinella elastica, Strain CCMP716" /LENGTH=73 /DNA_ID=CAMNT_0013394307 /DNA_START=37 /DNA_END=255 /DNA_ORIENTATION=+